MLISFAGWGLALSLYHLDVWLTPSILGSHLALYTPLDECDVLLHVWYRDMTGGIEKQRWRLERPPQGYGLSITSTPFNLGSAQLLDYQPNGVYYRAL